MAIVSCEHHSGMGLCSSCSEEQRQSFSQSTLKAMEYQKSALSPHKTTLRQAARIFEEAGNHYLAELIRAQIPY